MYILGIRADKLVESDIKRLIDHQIQESKSLDYKKELNISKDSDRKEFLYDISAMYNTDGGCIVFGIEEEKDSKNQNTGKPLKITGIEIENFDKLIQQIEDIVRNNTDPSINHLIINKIETDGKNVLVIGIPKCVWLPAMVTFNQSNKFFKRRISGKYAVDVYELNQMFMQNQVLSEKANNFREDRILKVLSQKSIPNLKVENSFFIHIIPFGFLNYQILDFSTAENALLKYMRPICSSGWDRMYNIDGFATYTPSYDENGRKIITSYNQIFRSGVYEIFSTDLFYRTIYDNKLGFDDQEFIEETIRSINEGLFVLNKMVVEPPFLISFSFHNVLGKIMDVKGRSLYLDFKQNELIFPLILVQNYETDIKKQLKPNFDILWQSFGFSHCPI